MGSGLSCVDDLYIASMAMIAKYDKEGEGKCIFDKKIQPNGFT